MEENLKEIIKKKVEYEDSCAAGRYMRAGYLAFAYARNGRQDCLDAMQQLGYLRTIPTESDAAAYFWHTSRKEECRRKIGELSRRPNLDNLGYHEIRMLERDRDESSESEERLISRITRMEDFLY